MLPCVCPVIDHNGDTLGYRLVCHFFVLTTFWRHLWSITEQTHGNMESILLSLRSIQSIVSQLRSGKNIGFSGPWINKFDINFRWAFL